MQSITEGGLSCLRLPARRSHTGGTEAHLEPYMFFFVVQGTIDILVVHLCEKSNEETSEAIPSIHGGN